MSSRSRASSRTSSRPSRRRRRRKRSRRRPPPPRLPDVERRDTHRRHTVCTRARFNLAVRRADGDDDDAAQTRSKAIDKCDRERDAGCGWRARDRDACAAPLHESASGKAGPPTSAAPGGFARVVALSEPGAARRVTPRCSSYSNEMFRGTCWLLHVDHFPRSEGRDLRPLGSRERGARPQARSRAGGAEGAFTTTDRFTCVSGLLPNNTHRKKGG